MATIIPGILTNDETDYVSRLEKAMAVAPLAQIDIIDGKFAPNNTIGVDVVGNHPTRRKLEVQLMVVDPESDIKKLVALDFISRIIFPFETDQDIARNISLIKDGHKQAGISINPETAVSAISQYADELDVLCIFSASPGFAGKKLENVVYPRIKEAKKLFPTLAVEIDIGVNTETAPKLVAAGADYLIATSALHNSPDYKIAYEQLAKLAQGG